MTTETTEIAIGAETDISTLPTLQTELRDAIVSGGHCHVATDALSDAHPALLQLLVGAHKRALEQGCRLDVDCAEGGVLATGLSKLGYLQARDAAPRIENGVWTGFTTYQ